MRNRKVFAGLFGVWEVTLRFSNTFVLISLINKDHFAIPNTDEDVQEVKMRFLKFESTSGFYLL